MSYIFQIIAIFLLILKHTFCDEDDEEEWASPCESIKNPKSYEDCRGKSTEFVYEACCFLKGVDNENVEEAECVDIERDHIRYDKNLNETKRLIINGTYWESYNLSYNSIEILRCDNYNISPSIIIILLILIVI